jgi:hypothetical protein
MLLHATDSLFAGGEPGLGAGGAGAAAAQGPLPLAPGAQRGGDGVRLRHGDRPPVRHKMAYVGYEADRGTVRYRCPAAHEGGDCASQGKGNAGKS